MYALVRTGETLRIPANVFMLFHWSVDQMVAANTKKRHNVLEKGGRGVLLLLANIEIFYEEGHAFVKPQGYIQCISSP